MFTYEAVMHNLVHVGALCYLVCFLFRDVMLLRAFAILGDLFYTAFYAYAFAQPIWGAMFWTVLNVLINLVMIWIILRDNRVSAFNDDELKLFRRLDHISPADFRKLVKLGKWRTAKEETVLAREGETLDQLYYVMEGGVSIEKAGRQIAASPGLFIGEIAFLRKRPASATVRVNSGTRYIAWPHAALAKALERHAELGGALGSVLNADLADKLARS